MKNAANDVIRSSGVDAEVVDATCIFDGTWQRRGYSSLVGAVACVSAFNSQVIDIEIMRKTCKVCQLSKIDPTSVKYQDLKEKHQCQKDYEGSAPGMELTGANLIYGRSVTERNLRYTKYVGDGDSKSYDSIAKGKPYGPDVTIKKLDCVGHVQKRVGAHLRNLKHISGKNKLADGKTLGGKGRLTLKEIDRLQMFYGLAIRCNAGDVVKMKQDISAILRHILSTDDNPNHSLCPSGPDTWCKYNRDPTVYKHTNPMPKAVAVHIKPVFDRLSKDYLLERCVDGYTQNAAESFNNILWHYCPKSTFVGAKPLNIAASLAIMTYNDGHENLLRLLSKIGLSYGRHTANVLKERDQRQLYLTKRNTSEKQKKIRRVNRKRKLQQQDDNAEKEGTVYATGGF